jgi:tetratricopeptide (TPR) repeat protein
MTSHHDRLRWLVCAGLVVITVAVYAPVRKHEFINYDDNKYILWNKQVQAGLSWSGFVWAFTTLEASNWHPLTWLSHMLDCQLFGLNAGAHHLVNVAFHALNAALLLLVLHRMTGAFWPSAFVAGIFALHPLRVESVAWAAERKDVLSGMFWVLTLWAYARYAEQQRTIRYVMVLLLFALGLMAKPMLVTLPFVLLLLDYWPLRRFGTAPVARLLWEKAPMFVLAAISSVVTVTAQRGAMPDVQVLTIGLRVNNALISYVAYIGKMLWPANLAVLYPLSSLIPARKVVGAIVLLAGISAAAILGARKRPYMLVGWLWYLGTLVPVIGLVQVGGQAMADRYTYIPLVGLAIAAAWSLQDWAGVDQVRQRILVGAGIAALLACAVTTRLHLRHWKSLVALFEHALRVGAVSPATLNALGCGYAERGDHAWAITLFDKAVEMYPDFADAYVNRATSYAKLSDNDRALSDYTRAIDLRVNSPVAYANRGVIYEIKGDLARALQDYNKAIEMKPTLAEAYYNRGRLHDSLGDSSRAIRDYEKAIELNPGYPQAYNNLAWILATSAEDALRDGNRAVRLAVRACELTGWKDAGFLDTLAAAYAEAGQFENAVRLAEQVLRLAQQTGQTGIARDKQITLQFYRQGRPYRKTARQ